MRRILSAKGEIGLFRAKEEIIKCLEDNGLMSDGKLFLSGSTFLLCGYAAQARGARRTGSSCR